MVAIREGEKDLGYVRIVLVEVRKRDANELIDSEPAEQSGILLKYTDHVIGFAVHPDRLANRIDLREQRIGHPAPDHSHGAVMFQIVRRDKPAGGYSTLRPE